MNNVRGVKRRGTLELAGLGLLLLALMVALVSGELLLVLAVSSAVIGLALVVSPRGLAVQQMASRPRIRRHREATISWARTAPARRQVRVLE